MKKKSGTRIYPLNLLKLYPDIKNFVSAYTLHGRAPLLQKNYGEANDCTLVSLTYILLNMDKRHNAEDVYEIVENSAKLYGYNGKTNGTNPLMIGSIMDSICTKKSKLAMVKGIGWNYEKVKSIIKSGSYIILNMMSDGRGYYKNHSVTVIGYQEYENHRFLAIYDNWNTGVSYIDYDKLSAISSINWYYSK